MIDPEEYYLAVRAYRETGIPGGPVLDKTALMFGVVRDRDEDDETFRNRLILRYGLRYNSRIPETVTIGEKK